MSKPKILFILTGSIACYKACQVISRLVQGGYEVQAAATESALKFVGAATLEGLTGKSVFSNVFESGRAMDHIELSKLADLAIICPASANSLNSLSQGIANDVAGNLFLAFDIKKKPILIAPAMNTMMWKHPATQASVARLTEWGVQVLEPGQGSLACGDTGEGRLQEPEQIYEAIQKRLARFV